MPIEHECRATAASRENADDIATLIANFLQVRLDPLPLEQSADMLRTGSLMACMIAVRLDANEIRTEGDDINPVHLAEQERFSLGQFPPPSFFS